MGRVTIYSIADSLGLSASTVSRAFTRPEMVNDAVRLRVLERAEEMGYQPNRAARRLATGSTGAIGLLIPDITNPYFPPLFRAIQGAAAAASNPMTVILADTKGAKDQEPSLVKRLKGQVDGLILASPLACADDLVSAVSGTPTVFLNRDIPGYSHVIYDVAPALHDAGDHLLALGHTHFALLTGTHGSWAAQQRRAAVETWAAKRKVRLIVFGPFPASYEGGREAATHLLTADVTAAFAFDDLTACGVVAGLDAAGRSVPDDCSVVGCDDVLLAQVLTPTLSTVTTPQDDLGAAALRLLRETMAGGAPEATRLLGEFVIRHSTGPVRRH